MSWELVIVTVPPRGDGLLAVLARAETLLDPSGCEECHDPDGEHAYGRVWDGGRPGFRFKGYLWMDRYGGLPEGRSFDKPVDESRRVADIDVQGTRLTPSALVPPDGEIHHLGGDRKAYDLSLADYAEIEDRLTANPHYFAVAFACHW